MITIKKGQTIDFRSPKVPAYIKETKETAGELARELSFPKEACATGEEKIGSNAEPERQKKEGKALRPSLSLWNKIKKGRNAIHQEG